MKYYDVESRYANRRSTIRITIQIGGFKGHLALYVEGNIRGKDLLQWSLFAETQEDIDNYVENDCNLRLANYVEVYRVLLHNDEGEEQEFEFCNEDEVSACIVGMEIIDCEMLT